jgi:probable HAF family extracellular repeat protein
MKTLPLHIRLLVFVSVLCCTTVVMAQATFTALGISSEAIDVSANGSVVVGFRTTGAGREAFRWTASGGMVGLGDLAGGDFFSAATGVSADGSVVVGYGRSVTGWDQAFRWTASGGMVGLGDLPGGDPQSSAEGVSGDGTIVVGIGSPLSPDRSPFRWTANSGMVALDALLNNTGGAAADVSANGTVVVGRIRIQTGIEAFRWTASGGMIGLGDFPGSGVNSQANAASADGSVIVGQGTKSDFLTEAFRWTTSGGMVGLGDLPGGNLNSSAADVSADGLVTVGTGDTGQFPTGNRAFLWIQGLGMFNLRDYLTARGAVIPDGLSLLGAHAVSADGLTIVGFGVDGGFNQVGWVATIPEPGTFTLGGVAACIYFITRPFRRSRLPCA